METDSPLSVAWVLVNSFLVISMQLGFAMLEVGSVREVHRMTVLAKNILDSCVSCLAFSTSCALLQPSIIYRDGYAQQHLMVFQWAFCATCVTICSGAMAERTHMLAYLTFTALMGGVVYPILAESAWGNGLFRDQFHDRFHEGYSYHDFAGSGVVHLVGGTGALVGNLILGRRIMQPEQGHFGAFGFEQGQHNLALGDAFRSGAAGAPGGDQSGEQALEEKDENDVLLKQGGGWPRRFDNLDRDRVEFMPLGYLQVTGMFTLWVGWYGFNAGSTLAMDPSAATAAGVIAWNTTMAAAMGGFGAFLSCCFFRERLDVGFISNGVLTGLVSITASCDVASTGDAAVLGLLSGLVVYPLSSYGLQVLRVDDPVDAVPVHLFGGLLGVFAVGLCQPDCVALESLGGGQAEQQRFCLEEHDVRRQMLAQVWGSLLELSFAAGCALVVWGFLAVSECARALEGDLLERACELLRAPAGVAPPPQGAAPEAGQAESAAMALRAIAKESPLARAVLRSHGLTSRGFAEGSPADAGRLRQDLQQARRERAETALEAGCVCGALAQMVHRCWPLRELALLRLRISPGNELSGLGAAATDRSQMVHSARRMVLQLVRAEATPHPCPAPITAGSAAARQRTGPAAGIPVHGAFRGLLSRESERVRLAATYGLVAPLLHPPRGACAGAAPAAAAAPRLLAAARPRLPRGRAEDTPPARGAPRGPGGGRGATAAWPRQPPRRPVEPAQGARRSAAALAASTAAAGWPRAPAPPALSGPGECRLFAPAAAKERARDPRFATAKAVEFEMWLEGGYLHVLAASLPFAQALPVHASDLRGPELPSLLRAWQEARAERWAAFERYMLDAVLAPGVLGLAASVLGLPQNVVRLDARGNELDRAWHVGRSGERWRFEFAHC
ncbi:unnamed protein product [Prorocentrum cordatum]|uniref:Ammonium transporter AmtB-like domain-containing protein n=1 Tax=Prorocentrum cordatum TaxID=2364126 RepID=A0ABN9R2U9_9DINO|nr:unnamed protein product [Polarella glacialis]